MTLRAARTKNVTKAAAPNTAPVVLGQLSVDKVREPLLKAASTRQIYATIEPV